MENNTIELLAFDMDNTLLLPDKSLSTRNAQALKQLHANGKHIILTTGRPLPNVAPFIEQLGLTQSDDYVILFNGGMIKNTHTNENILNRHFILKDMQAAFHIITDLGLPIDIVAEKQVYSITDFGQSDYVKLVNGIVPYQQVALADLPNDLVFNKFVIYADEAQLDHLETVLQQHPELNHILSFVRSRRILLEIVPSGVNKGSALSALLEHFNLTAENLMAFGDEENDYPMLKLAKVGVAMDNAIPQIKDIATDITKSNADDGVGVFLEKYFNL